MKIDTMLCPDLGAATVHLLGGERSLLPAGRRGQAPGDPVNLTGAQRRS